MWGSTRRPSSCSELTFYSAVITEIDVLWVNEKTDRRPTIIKLDIFIGVDFRFSEKPSLHFSDTEEWSFAAIQLLCSYSETWF